MPGQITLDTAFGRALRDLASDTRFKVYVEIGTWDGQGSTKCIVDGLNARADLSGAGLFSFEANRTQWALATKYWQARGDQPLRVIMGRPSERMMGREKIESHPLFSCIKTHYDLHYEQDLKDFKEAPLVRMRKCDVAVLDGGEFCGEGDWDAIRPLKPAVVALDDIKVMKNNATYELLKKEGWRELFHTDERNGSAILLSPDFLDFFTNSR